MRPYSICPETKQHSLCVNWNDLRISLSSMQGWRSSMEDAHTVCLTLPSPFHSYSFFGMFDGHEGDTAAKYCAEHLIGHIMRTKEFLQLKDKGPPSREEDQQALIKQGLISGFLDLDEALRQVPQFQSGANRAGSTAVCALVTPDTVYFANCGDSRGIIVSKECVTAATLDHKPINPLERKRIQEAGGSVFLQRVNGSLAVSRALGDFEYKNVPDKGPCEQLVSPEPEITVWDRSQSADEFIVLACDGVWDVMSNDDVCQFIRDQLTVTEDLELISQRIVDTCLNKGSRDNISVILIVFPGAPKVSQEAHPNEASVSHPHLAEKDVHSNQQMPMCKSLDISPTLSHLVRTNVTRQWNPAEPRSWLR